MEHQLDATREMILEAAQVLFLSQGLAETSMIDIAKAAGVTKVTLYRYFPDRHPIAFEIAARMLAKIGAAAVPERASSLPIKALLKEYFLRIIRAFPGLVDAYRYLGLFDHIYSSGYPDDALANRYRRLLTATIETALRVGPGEGRASPVFPVAVTAINAVISFLQKMASRGELLGKEQGVDVATQLEIFESLIADLYDVKLAPLID